MFSKSNTYLFFIVFLFVLACKKEEENVVIPVVKTQVIRLETKEKRNSIYFKDESTGFITGNNGLLIRSDDGGNTWNIKSPPSANHLLRIFFVTDDTGFIIATPELLRTSDGGHTWQKLSYAFDDLSMVDESVGYALDNYNLTKQIYKTANGGITWSLISSFYGDHYYRIFFTSRDTGIVIGNDALRVTYNGGVSFTTSSGVVIKSPNWFHAVSDKELVALSSFNSSKTTADYLVKSVDGGLTWSRHSLGIETSSFFFVSPSQGFAGGDKMLMGSADHGQTWEQLLSSDLNSVSYAFSALWFRDAITGFAIGGYYSEGLRSDHNADSTYIMKIITK